MNGLFLLLQVKAKSEEVLDAQYWLAIVIVILIVASVLFIYVKRTARKFREAEMESADPLTMLYEQHKQGILTDEEYQQARAALMGKIKKRMLEKEAREAEEGEGDGEELTDEEVEVELGEEELVGGEANLPEVVEEIEDEDNGEGSGDEDEGETKREG